MSRLVQILGFTLVAIGVCHAHDPYEISSVVYLRSNQIELFIEVEFPTGMLLAGEKPSRDKDAQSQFEAALPRLEQFAGGLFEITAGNNVVLPLRTNVELGVETHIRGHLEFALTDYRPLRFVPRGLRAMPDVPYGVSLTVLDMVNKKVLGQAALFADSPPADFPATVSNPNPLAGAQLPVIRTNGPSVAAVSPNIPVAAAAANKLPGSRLLATVVVFAGVAVLLVAWRWSQTRS